MDICAIFNGAENFINVRTQKICYREEVSVGEVNYFFMKACNFRVYVLLLSFL